MRIYIGSDHAGFELKDQLRDYLRDQGHDVTDVGTDSGESVDYPDYAVKVAEAVSRGDAERGVLVCGSGIGMAIAANKVDGVRAANVYDPELARMSRLHNDANVVSLASRYTDRKTAEAILEEFLGTEFEGGRHERRVEKMERIERE